MVKAEQSGFTLLEMMIVVAISAILTSMAAPSFRDLIANNRIRAATSDLQNGLLFARSEAAKRNNQVVVARTGATWQDGWVVRDADDVVLVTGAASKRIVVTSAVASVTYLSSGRIDGGSPSFQLLDEGKHGQPRCLRSDRSGHAFVVKGECP